MAHKQTRCRSHLAFRHRSQTPLPAVDDVEQRRLDVLSPSLLAPRPRERRDPRQPHRRIRMRQRRLTRPVIVAILVSLVWRRVPSIAEVQKILSRAGLLVHYRDESIQGGQSRSNSCTPPRRLVSVLWQGVWYRSLTHVLEPQALSARQVGEWYRRRWRIEDAFAWTQRLLALADVWPGSTKAVQLQLDATLMF